jgi:hypothetical protein
MVMRSWAAVTGLVLPAVLGSACGNKTARAPNPTAYDWPDSLSYVVEMTGGPGPGAEGASPRWEVKRLYFAVRNDRYLIWHDSLRWLGREPGATPAPPRPWPEDTLHYYVRLSRLGEILDAEPDCDPAIAACKAALPSALPLEIRHIVPRLPVWWPPKGHPWVDTLAFDDLPRARGRRGSVITRYRAARDTTVAGRGYWIVTWTSAKRFEAAAPMPASSAAPVEERGTVFVDKDRLIPACATWSGASAAPAAASPVAEMARTGPGGRAYLTGSPCERLIPGQ